MHVTQERGEGSLAKTATKSDAGGGVTAKKTDTTRPYCRKKMHPYIKMHGEKKLFLKKMKIQEIEFNFKCPFDIHVCPTEI